MQPCRTKDSLRLKAKRKRPASSKRRFAVQASCRPHSISSDPLQPFIACHAALQCMASVTPSNQRLPLLYSTKEGAGKTTDVPALPRQPFPPLDSPHPAPPPFKELPKGGRTSRGRMLLVSVPPRPQRVGVKASALLLFGCAVFNAVIASGTSVVFPAPLTTSDHPKPLQGFKETELSHILQKAGKLSASTARHNGIISPRPCIATVSPVLWLLWSFAARPLHCPPRGAPLSHPLCVLLSTPPTLRLGSSASISVHGKIWGAPRLWLNGDFRKPFFEAEG